MSHGYFYICDQCGEHLEIPETKFRYSNGGYYKSPKNWMHTFGLEEKDFCSKKCAKNYAEGCK